MYAFNNTNFRPHNARMSGAEMTGLSVINWGRGSGIGTQWTRRSGRKTIRGRRQAQKHITSRHMSACFMGERPTLSAYPVFFRKRKTFFLNKSRK
jgi:hypothetical protein